MLKQLYKLEDVLDLKGQVSSFFNIMGNFLNCYFQGFIERVIEMWLMVGCQSGKVYLKANTKAELNQLAITKYKRTDNATTRFRQELYPEPMRYMRATH